MSDRLIALITNTIRPYCFDVPRLMALPDQFEYRFRYRERWLQRGLQGTGMQGRAAVIVMRDFDTSGFHAIRLARITKVEEYGEIKHIVFAVCEYPSKHWRDEVVHILQQTLKAIHETNVGGRDLSPLVLELDASFPDSTDRNDSEQAKHWDDVVSSLGGLECFKDYSFFRVLGVKDSKKRETPTASYEGRGGRAFKLSPAKSYDLQVLQKLPWRLSENESISNPFEVKLTTTGSALALVRDSETVVGKYDVLSFLFRTSETKIEQNTHLEIAAPQPGTGGVDAPHVWLGVLITPTIGARVLSALAIVVVVVGILTMGFAEELSKWLSVEFVTPNFFRASALFLIALGSGQWADLIKAFLGRAKDVA